MIFDGENPYKATDLIMGTVPVEIDSVRQLGTALYVQGEQFTRWSQVVINGEAYDTVRLSEYALLVRDYILEDGDEICVQQATSRKVYCTTRTITYQMTKKEGDSP